MLLDDCMTPHHAQCLRPVAAPNERDTSNCRVRLMRSTVREWISCHCRLRSSALGRVGRKGREGGDGISIHSHTEVQCSREKMNLSGRRFGSISRKNRSFRFAFLHRQDILFQNRDADVRKGRVFALRRKIIVLFPLSRGITCNERGNGAHRPPVAIDMLELRPGAVPAR